MAGREWKPGDVALVQNEYGVHNVAIYSVVPGGYVWKYGVADTKSPLNADARPLAVIDPEDVKSSAALLWSYLKNAGGIDVPSHPHFTSAMQAALREFANPTPPKPDEPTGLGAVVETASGDRWVFAPTWADDDAPWMCVGPSEHGAGECEPWSRVNAVRVLSPGVDS